MHLSPSRILPAVRCRTTCLAGLGLAFVLVCTQHAVQGGTVSIQRTPILTATLPTGTTFEVDASTNGTTWVPTGILVAGSGVPASVRLDGASDRLQYRYSRVGATALVTPTVTLGLNLSNNFPGATELRIESTPQLSASAWTLQRSIYPDLNGAFLSAWRSPGPTSHFARTVQPATPTEIATVASYFANPSNLGFAGFGLVVDDMPQLYRDGFLAAACPAFYHRGGSNAAAAGECYEFFGPVGTATVMVADMAALWPTGTCDSGRSYFDIGISAFTPLFGVSGGTGIATYRLVPAPVTGNLKLVVVNYFNAFSFQFRVYNHRAGVAKLELRGTGSSTWVDLPREQNNAFTYTGLAPVYPVSIRATSRFGEVVEFPPIPSLATGQRFAATNQFAVFPALEPAPAWILPPVYRDDFGGVPGWRWTVTPFGGVTVNPTNPAAAFQGSAGLSVSNWLAFSGMVFASPQRFAKPPDGLLEFAVRSATPSTVSNLTLQIAGFDPAGMSATSSTLQLPAVSNAWRVLRVPLDSALTPFYIKDFRLLSGGGGAPGPVYLDSIFFRQP